MKIEMDGTGRLADGARVRHTPPARIIERFGFGTVVWADDQWVRVAWDDGKRRTVPPSHVTPEPSATPTIGIARSATT